MHLALESRHLQDFNTHREKRIFFLFKKIKQSVIKTQLLLLNILNYSVLVCFF